MKALARPKITLLAVAILGLLSMAPTPGDIGGCGQEPLLMDAEVFFANKKATDCERCTECKLETNRCDEACDPTRPVEESFAEGCLPLVHDGEVCLRALRYADCDDYSGYVSDFSPTAPTECNFCPPRGAR